MYYQVTLKEITSKDDSIQVVRNIGQEVISQGSHQDKDDIHQKQKEITVNFPDVEDKGSVKAKTQEADFDANVEQPDELFTDDATMEQHAKNIRV